MPIKQERMIDVVDTANALLEGYKVMYRILRDNTIDITNANSAVEHSQDPRVREAVQQLVNMLQIIATTINETVNNNLAAIGRLQGEKQYFERMRKINERAATYQRQKRYNDTSLSPAERMQAKMMNEKLVDELGMLPPIKPVGSAASASNPFELTPEYKRFQETMRRKYEREREQYPGLKQEPIFEVVPPPEEFRANFAPKPEPTTQLEVNAEGLVARVGKDGVTRWLPPDNIINAPPINSDEDLL